MKVRVEEGTCGGEGDVERKVRLGKEGEAMGKEGEVWNGR